MNDQLGTSEINVSKGNRFSITWGTWKTEGIWSLPLWHTEV